MMLLQLSIFFFFSPTFTWFFNSKVHLSNSVQLPPTTEHCPVWAAGALRNKQVLSKLYLTPQENINSLKMYHCHVRNRTLSQGCVLAGTASLQRKRFLISVRLESFPYKVMSILVNAASSKHKEILSLVKQHPCHAREFNFSNLCIFVAQRNIKCSQKLILVVQENLKLSYCWLISHGVSIN